jgi:hypothetical protein
LERELSVFAWSGSSVCPTDFLRTLVQPHGLRKLRGNCLTAFDRSDVIRLHQIVFASLGADWCPPARRAELDAALESFSHRRRGGARSAPFDYRPGVCSTSVQVMGQACAGGETIWAATVDLLHYCHGQPV